MILAAALAAAALVAPAPGVNLVAAGDVASCRSRGDEATAALVARLPGTVAVLGDSVYEIGSDEDYRRCYAPSWGRFKGRTRPAPGNHEYGTPGAAGYFHYFGAAAGPPGRGYYAYRLGSWQVVVLNTNCAAAGCGVGSPQERWLRGVLASSKAICTVAYGHHPRLSSGFHGPDRTVQPLWDALQDARVELYLAAHDHHYERFAPSRGLRQFVVGTGGRSAYPILRNLAGSRAHWSGGYGVLSLRLLEGSYAWRFVGVPREEYTDAGSARCV